MNLNSPEEIKERISISTAVFDQYMPLDEMALEQIAEAGIKKIELLESPQQFNLSLAGSMGYIAGMCRKAGVSIASYYSRFILPAGIESERELSRLTDTCKGQLETLQEAGGNIWSSHAMFADQTVYKLYERLLRFIEGTDVKLAIENFDASYPTCVNNRFYWNLAGCEDYGRVKQAVDDFQSQAQLRDVKDRMKFLRELDHPQLGILLNIGHVRDDTGRNPVTLPGGSAEILRQCGHKLVHIHLYGLKAGMEQCPPMDEGDQVKWEEIFETLRDMDYGGYFNFVSRGMPLYKDTISRVSAMREIILRR